MLKRIVCSIWILFFCVIFFSPSGNAASYSAFEFINEETEYYEFVKKADLPDHVVVYDEDWRAIGVFDSFWVPNEDFRSYCYGLRETGSCFYDLEVSMRDRNSPYAMPDRDIVPPEQNLLYNSNVSKDEFVGSKIGDLCYVYNSDGALDSIQWCENEDQYVVWYSISFSGEYPRGELFSRLFNVETATAAGDELISIVCEYKSSHLLWVGIGGGAAVVMVGAVAAALIVRKKRRRATADVEN